MFNGRAPSGREARVEEASDEESIFVPGEDEMHNREVDFEEGILVPGEDEMHKREVNFFSSTPSTAERVEEIGHEKSAEENASTPRVLKEEEVNRGARLSQKQEERKVGAIPVSADGARMPRMLGEEKAKRAARLMHKQEERKEEVKAIPANAVRIPRLLGEEKTNRAARLMHNQEERKEEVGAIPVNTTRVPRRLGEEKAKRAARLMHKPEERKEEEVGTIPVNLTWVPRRLGEEKAKRAARGEQKPEERKEEKVGAIQVNNASTHRYRTKAQKLRRFQERRHGNPVVTTVGQEGVTQQPPAANSNAQASSRRLGDRKAKRRGGPPRSLGMPTSRQRPPAGARRALGDRKGKPGRRPVAPSLLLQEENTTPEPTVQHATRFQRKQAKRPRPIASNTRTNMVPSHGSPSNYLEDQQHHLSSSTSSDNSGRMEAERRIMDPLLQPPEQSGSNASDEQTQSGHIVSECKLVVARPVRDPSQTHLPLAEEVDKAEERTLLAAKRKTKHLKRLGASAACLALVAGAIMLAVFFAKKPSSKNADSLGMEPLVPFIDVLNVVSAETAHENSTVAVELVEDLPFSKYILTLLPSDTVQNINRTRTPQNRAYQWMLDDPFSGNYSDARIIQRFALAALYYSTNGDQWYTNKGWLSYTEHECNWFSGGGKPPEDFYAVFIESIYQYTFDVDRPCADDDGNESEHIKHIWLHNNGLKGTLPNEIYALTRLETINFFTNLLSGGISDKIGQLTGLRGIALAVNGIGGSIPKQIASMQSLEVAILNNCGLDGTIPSEIGFLSGLVYLWLDNNILTGSIPSEIGKLGKLETLQIWSNHLTGLIPSEMGLMSSLWITWMDNNKLSGRIPSELGQLQALHDTQPFIDKFNEIYPSYFTTFVEEDSMGHLSFINNAISGSIPSQLGLLSSLKRLELNRNNLTQQIPSELGSLTKMTRLEIGDTFLTGPIPSEIGSATSLGRIYLRNNFLSGQIPSELGQLTSLHSLHLYNNNLTGALFSELGQLTALNYLGAFENALRGVIPSELCQLTALTKLVLADNQLTGTIPSSLARLTNLVGLFLYTNDLGGPIPTELGQLTNLVGLWLDDNALGGPIPTELGQLTSLTSLEFQSNDLSGVVPEELCSSVGFIFDCSDKLCGCEWCPCDNHAMLDNTNGTELDELLLMSVKTFGSEEMEDESMEP